LFVCPRAFVSAWAAKDTFRPGGSKTTSSGHDSLGLPWHAGAWDGAQGLGTFWLTYQSVFQRILQLLLNCVAKTLFIHSKMALVERCHLKKRESSLMFTLNGNDIMLGDFVLRSFIHAFIFAFIQFRSIPFHCIHAFIHALMPFNSAPFHSVIIQLFIIHSIIYSFLHSFLPSFLHSFLPSFIPSFIHSFIHWAKTFNTHYMTL